MLSGASVPNTMVYESSGTAIARADVVTRHGPGGAIIGAMCFHDDDVALGSALVLIDVPVEMPAAPASAADQPRVRELSEEEALTSTQAVRFRVVGGAPPLFLIEAE
jgi:hypothetical protein